MKEQIKEALQTHLPSAETLVIYQYDDKFMRFKWRKSEFKLTLGGSICVSEIEGVFSHATDKSMLLDALLKKILVEMQ